MVDVVIPEMLKSALTWLDRGVALFPIQPNSKHAVYGFGPYKKQIVSPPEAARVWGKGSHFNLAIVAAADMLILDFDDGDLYRRWQDEIDPYYGATYQEQTPRGWHVFFWGKEPDGMCLVKGVEVKRFVLVAPSKLNGFVYTPTDPSVPIVKVTNALKIFSFLLSEEPQPYPKHDPKKKPTAPTDQSDDVITRIKSLYPLAKLIGRFTELKPSGRGEQRWMIGCCPFHNDTHPSLWVDTERNTWGCHACGIRGDVINFYARINNLTVQAAIRELAGRPRE